MKVTQTPVKGTGCDYFLLPSPGVLDFGPALEVSGLLRAATGEPNRRLRSKARQLRDGRQNSPRAIVGVAVLDGPLLCFAELEQ